jgi:tetratricopeptide (TPR) repeat protein
MTTCVPRFGLSLVLFLGVLAAVRPALADDAARARKLYREGAKRYDLGEYEEALRQFRDAYRASPDPTYLFNIGQCQRKLGRADEAIGSFKSYLRHLPANHPRRDDVEKIVADLQAELDRKRAADRPPPVEPPPPSLAVRPPPPPPERPAAFVAERPAPPPAEEPIYKKGWFWGTVGGVLVAGGVTAFLIARSGKSEPLACGDCNWMTYKVPTP